MRVANVLTDEQALVTRFLAVLGRGLVIAGRGKAARPGFFIYACNFIQEYLEPEYLPKEEVLLKGLEDCGFAPDEGPVGNMRHEQARSREISKMLFEAAKDWQAGNEDGRADVVWATSEYSELMHHHFERLKNLIYPLLDQSLTPLDEQKIAEQLNLIEFADRDRQDPDKYKKIVKMLEDEVKDWER